MNKIEEYVRAKETLASLVAAHAKTQQGSGDVVVVRRDSGCGGRLYENAIVSRYLARAFEEYSFTIFGNAITKAKQDVEAARLAAQEEAREILKD